MKYSWAPSRILVPNHEVEIHHRTETCRQESKQMFGSCVDCTSSLSRSRSSVVSCRVHKTHYSYLCHARCGKYTKRYTTYTLHIKRSISIPSTHSSARFRIYQSSGISIHLLTSIDLKTSHERHKPGTNEKGEGGVETPTQQQIRQETKM